MNVGGKVTKVPKLNEARAIEQGMQENCACELLTGGARQFWSNVMENRLFEWNKSTKSFSCDSYSILPIFPHDIKVSLLSV